MRGTFNIHTKYETNCAEKGPYGMTQMYDIMGYEGALYVPPSGDFASF